MSVTVTQKNQLAIQAENQPAPNELKEKTSKSKATTHSAVMTVQSFFAI